MVDHPSIVTASWHARPGEHDTVFPACPPFGELRSDPNPFFDFFERVRNEKETQNGVQAQVLFWTYLLSHRLQRLVTRLELEFSIGLFLSLTF